MPPRAGVVEKEESIPVPAKPREDVVEKDSTPELAKPRDEVVEKEEPMPALAAPRDDVVEKDSPPALAMPEIDP